jgi:hypothetical protein
MTTGSPHNTAPNRIDTVNFWLALAVLFSCTCYAVWWFYWSIAANSGIAKALFIVSISMLALQALCAFIADCKQTTQEKDNAWTLFVAVVASIVVILNLDEVAKDYFDDLPWHSDVSTIMTGAALAVQTTFLWLSRRSDNA